MKIHFSAVLGIMTVTLFFSGGTAVAQIEGWEELNPAFQGAAFVNDASVCSVCHEDAQETFDHTTHAKEFQFGEAPVDGVCESCHGPRSQHIENPGDELSLSGKQWSAVCLQCHEGGDHIYWKSGTHATAGVNCTDCHDVMEQMGDQGLMAAGQEESVCYTCHADVRAQMQKIYHHPVREGKMNCSDCHNVHGSVGKNLLKGATVNEVCFTCHQEKRGPFVWEHAPVLENCSNCHNAHGSNHGDLLNAKGSFLCLQCHSYGGHINLPRYNRTSNPYGQGCVNCHLTQHGSNSPSGAKFTR